MVQSTHAQFSRFVVARGLIPPLFLSSHPVIRSLSLSLQTRARNFLQNRRAAGRAFQLSATAAACTALQLGLPRIVPTVSEELFDNNDPLPFLSLNFAISRTDETRSLKESAARCPFVLSLFLSLTQTSARGLNSRGRRRPPTSQKCTRRDREARSSS